MAFYLRVVRLRFLILPNMDHILLRRFLATGNQCIADPSKPRDAAFSHRQMCSDSFTRTKRSRRTKWECFDFALWTILSARHGESAVMFGLSYSVKIRLIYRVQRAKYILPVLFGRVTFPMLSKSGTSELFGAPTLRTFHGLTYQVTGAETEHFISPLS